MHAEQTGRPNRRARLLGPQPVPVRSDVFLHGLSPFVLESLRRATEQGLTPTSLRSQWMAPIESAGGPA
jgi:hypothetical protein